MKKLLLLSLMALMPCAMITSGNNGTAPQLSGTKATKDTNPAMNSPMQPYMGMNAAQEGMTCPTEEELMAGLEEYMQYFDSLSPEEQQQEINKAVQALPQEVQEELGLLAMEELGQEILSTPEGQAFAEGVQAGAELGAAAKEAEIVQEVEAMAQEMAPMLEAEMAKNGAMPKVPALK